MCLEFVIKYLLFFVNFVFWLAGIALIGIGIAVLINVNEILDLIPRDLSGIPIAVIVAGSIVFVVAFSGCYGAITESRCWLIMFAVFMLILAAGKSYLAYLLFSQLDVLPQTVTGWVNDAFNNNLDNNNFQIFEVTFLCCGSTGPDAYTSLGRPLPPTCCPEPENFMCAVNDSYRGCSARLGDYLDSFGEAVGIILIVIIVVEVIAMLSAFYMNHTITRRKQTGRMY